MKKINFIMISLLFLIPFKLYSNNPDSDQILTIENTTKSDLKITIKSKNFGNKHNNDDTIITLKPNEKHSLPNDISFKHIQIQ